MHFYSIQLSISLFLACFSLSMSQLAAVGEAVNAKVTQYNKLQEFNEASIDALLDKGWYGNVLSFFQGEDLQNLIDEDPTCLSSKMFPYIRKKIDEGQSSMALAFTSAFHHVKDCTTELLVEYMFCRNIIFADFMLASLMTQGKNDKISKQEVEQVFIRISSNIIGVNNLTSKILKTAKAKFVAYMQSTFAKASLSKHAAWCCALDSIDDIHVILKRVKVNDIVFAYEEERQEVYLASLTKDVLAALDKEIQEIERIENSEWNKRSGLGKAAYYMTFGYW